MAEAQGLFSNKLFLQYLAAGGQDISQGNPLGTNVNTVTNQAITAQNWKNYMLEMLGPNKVPGGKATVDDTGLTLKVPSSILGEDPMGGGEVPGGGTEGAMTMAPTPAVAPAAGGGVVPRPNPFSSGLSNLSDSDLAGLTPGQMTTGMEMALRSKAAPLDAAYKRALIERTLRPEVAKDDRTTLQKNYAWAVENGYKGTPEQWKNVDTTAFRNWRHAVDGGSSDTFEEYQTKMATLTGGMPLEEKVKQERALTDLENELYFSSKHFVSDTQKEITGRTAKRAISNRPKGMSQTEATQRETVKSVERRIEAGGHEVIDVVWAPDGRTMIWKVKFKTGEEGEVKYVIRP